MDNGLQGQINTFSKMPLFKSYRKDSTGNKAKLQHKLYLAKENPEPIFDLSDCELTQVPPGIYSLCKVLRKEVLLLQNNKLSCLDGGGNIKDLSLLQTINLGYNVLHSLPDNFDKLQSLQTLLLSGNKFKQFPECLCRLRRLRYLDISENEITVLPPSLAQIPTLETLVLDAENMQYPDSEIAKAGTEKIRKFLCSALGIPYLPAWEHLSSPSESSDSTCGSSPSSPQQDEVLMESLQHYERHKEKKRQQLLALEKELLLMQKQQASIAVTALKKKQQLLEAVAQEQDKVCDELNVVQQRKLYEHQQLINQLYEEERNATDLITKLIEMNEKAKKTEAVLEEMERQRLEAEEWFVVRYEELQNLRRHEVLANMQEMLQSEYSIEKLRQAYEMNKSEAMKRAQDSDLECDVQLGRLLLEKEQDQIELIQRLMVEEMFQKEAFEALQLQKDSKHKRLVQQIILIENQLLHLTLIENERRRLKVEFERDLLEQKRMELTCLLVQMLKEKEKREAELKQRMLEMEECRQKDQVDFWLIQYQRLMDRKPQALYDQEFALELAVKSILEISGAYEYISMFARHRVTIETLCQMTDEKLMQIGVNEMGLRQSILNAIEDYIASNKLSSGMKTEGASALPLTATAPPQIEPTSPLEITPRVFSECCVCMEEQCSVLFLNCGHVCCCIKCSEPLTTCPMCRADIIQKIRLTQMFPTLEEEH